MSANFPPMVKRLKHLLPQKSGVLPLLLRNHYDNPGEGQTPELPRVEIERKASSLFGKGA
jgi:hypothetical protein